MDDALKKVTVGGHEVPTVLVYDHERAAARADVPFVQGRDVWWQDAVSRQPTTCEVEWMGAEDPLFKVRGMGFGKRAGVCSLEHIRLQSMISRQPTTISG